MKFESDFMKKRNMYHRSLSKKMPGITQQFDELMEMCFEDGSLSSKDKELIALGISVTQRCEPCMHYHIEHAVKKGATEGEILEAMQIGYEMAVGTIIPPLRKVIHEEFFETEE